MQSVTSTAYRPHSAYNDKMIKYPAPALLEMSFHSFSAPPHASLNFNEPAFCGKSSSGW